MRGLGLSPAGSPALGRCTSNAGPGSRWLMKTSSPGCATRTWKMMRMELLPLQSLIRESAPGQGQGFWACVYPELPVVLQHYKQRHPALLQCLLQLDPTSFDPEKPPGSAGLLPASAAGPRGHQFRWEIPEPGWESDVEDPALTPSVLPPPRPHVCAVLILVGVGLEVAPSPGVSSAIFFVPGVLLLVPGVYHVIFIYCAVKGHRGFQFFYLPYFEK